MSASDVLKALRAPNLRKVDVAGITVHVRGLSGAERKLLIQRANDSTPLQVNELVALAACNEDGSPLFTLEQADELDQLDGACLQTIAEAVLEASGLTAKASETAAKN